MIRNLTTLSLRKFLPALAVWLALLGVFQSPASAQAPTPSDDDVNRVAQRLYCPTCENTPLDVCPTTSCAQWRELIREKLAQGWTDDQVVEYFAQQYGDRVLADLPARGFHWLAFILPAVLFIFSAAGLIAILRNARRHRAQPVADQPPATDYARKIEEELRRRGEQ